MQRLKIFAAAVLALCSLMVPLRSDAQAGQKNRDRASAAGVEQQIDGLTQQMVQAQLHADPVPYQQYYAEDATIVHASGQLFTKSEEVANLKSGEAKYDSYDVRNKRIRLYGATAVVELLAAVKGTLKGQPFDAEFRVTRVWAKSNGKWRVVVFQTTRVASPSR